MANVRSKCSNCKRWMCDDPTEKTPLRRSLSDDELCVECVSEQAKGEPMAKKKSSGKLSKEGEAILEVVHAAVADTCRRHGEDVPSLEELVEQVKERL